MDYNYRDELSKAGITKTDSGRQVCPECSVSRSNKTEKCLRVTYDDDAVKYHCHHCGYSGAVSYTKNTNIFKKSKEFKRPEAIKPKENKSRLVEYFESRGLSQKSIEEYGIFQDEKGGVVFPYFKNGQLVNNKVRFVNKETGKKGFIQTAGAEQTLYGMDNIPTDCKKLIWVEGEFDVLSFYEVGEYAVSPNQGGSDKKLDCFENCFDFINSFDEHIIAVDNDEVGRILADNLKERLKHKIVKVVDWSVYSTPNKDANDFTKRGESIVLKDALNLAKEIKSETIETFEDNLEEALKIFRGEKRNTFSTGWGNLDKLFKIQTGRLMVVSGVSKFGKSFFVDNLLFNLSTLHGFKHFVCSFEGDIYDHITTFAEMDTGLPTNKSVINCMSDNQFEESARKWSNYILRIKTDKLYTIDEIVEQAEYCVLRYGIKTITIDPYNKLKNPSDSGREDKYIEQILSKMLLFARKYNVLVIFIAHPRHRIEERPTLSTISGGGAWHSMADYGIIVHRERLKNDQLSNVSEIFVEKVKSRVLGNPNGGCEYLEYDFRIRKLIPTEKPEKGNDKVW